ncbi:MAG: PstS family phosphate ABC transporter substrate-binding protein [Marinifilaceae bacterium]
MLNYKRVIKGFFLISLSIVANITIGNDFLFASQRAKFTPQLDENYKGQIQLSGAFALYPMAVRWAEEFKKIYPKIRIDISAGGAGKGITDALSGMVDIGMVSRDIYPEEEAKGLFHISVVKDAIVITMNSNNPLFAEIQQKGITPETAYELWGKGEMKTWGQFLGTNSKIPIHVYTRSDACGAAETFAAWINIKQEDLEGTAVYGDPGVTSVIQRDKLGIGYNNLAYAYDLITQLPYNGIAVCPIDLNGNGKIDEDEAFYANSKLLNEAIATGKYPSPPARDLYFVSKGVPQRKEVMEFFRFVLTKGQDYAHEVAYVPLSNECVDAQLSKLSK